MSSREGVARLTRVAQPAPSEGLMPPLRTPPPSQRPTPPKGGGLVAPKGGGLMAPTGVARLTPRARAAEEAARELRRVMGRFATGVTVVTTVERDVIHGMTANSFLSVSLRPPLVLVSLGRCKMNDMLCRTNWYGISVLAADQEHFAAHFAAQSVSPVEPSFDWEHDVPLLQGALGQVVCRVVDSHRAGDHMLWIGQVEHMRHRDGVPLLFYTGRFGSWSDLKRENEDG